MAKYVETYRGVIYPWQCDQMGHLNVQHYVGLYDQAACHLFAAMGHTPSYMAETNMGYADVRNVIEYRAELRAGALVRMESRFLGIGTKSVRHEHRLVNADNGNLAATFEAVSVHFDMGARKATPFPPEMRRKIEELIAAAEG